MSANVTVLLGFVFLCVLCRCCDRLRCTACDFDVLRFDEKEWAADVDYMFLRNCVPNTEKLSHKLVHTHSLTHSLTHANAIDFNLIVIFNSILIWRLMLLLLLVLLLLLLLLLLL